ncbi:hypothetical protein KLEB273_gp125 [Bacillus phage vB_BauM_KLEB27-3]|nr:hypothetical protein KLEB273_gp125 [Bacillus phage vB_BauM_KLEB27-3]
MAKSVEYQKMERLIQLRKERASIIREMDQIQSELIDLEFMYQGHYASILHLNGRTQNATIYVENNNGENWEVDLSLQELLFFI